MPEPRTVLLLHSSAGLYGADRQLLLIAAGLDRDRYRPLVVLAQDGPLRAALVEAGVETLVRPLAVLRRSEFSAGGLAGVAGRVALDAGELGSLIRRRGVALVHTNTSVTLSGMAATRVARVPHVWHVREIYSGFDRSWRAYRRVLERADALACVSEATRAQFTDRGRTHVVFDGVEVPAGGSARADTRAALALGEDQIALLVAGRISDWKGQELLVAALARATELRDAIALIAGDAWPGQEREVARLVARARSLGLADRVRVLGFRDDIADLYRAADVVVVPSTRPDPLPNSALEAAAGGACVVAADHGGLPEIVRDGETGRLFAPGDERALAAVLGELARDSEQRERLGSAAAVDVRERFAPARLRERVNALYDGLLGA